MLTFIFEKYSIYLEEVYLVTALVPSDTACLASSQGRRLISLINKPQRATQARSSSVMQLCLSVQQQQQQQQQQQCDAAVLHHTAAPELLFRTLPSRITVGVRVASYAERLLDVFNYLTSDFGHRAVF